MTGKLTTKINTWNRKTIAVFLAVAMMISVFTGTGFVLKTKASMQDADVNDKAMMDRLIDNYDNIANDFDYYKYAGNLLASGDRNRIIRGLCKYETPSASLATDLEKNLGYRTAYWAWRGFDDTEDIKNHYTTIILKSISDYYAKETFISSVNQSSIKHVIKFRNYINSIVGASSEYSILKDIVKSKPDISKWSDEEKTAISKCVDDYVNLQKMTYIGPVINGKTFSRAIKFLGYCKTYDQFSEKVGSYVALEEVQNDTIEFLKDVRKNADIVTCTDYKAFVESLDTIIEIAQGNEDVFFEQINKDAYNLFGKPLIEKALKSLFIKAVSAYLSGGATLMISAVINVVKVAAEITKAVGNICFSVDQKLDTYQVMRCLRDYESAIQKALYSDLTSINSFKDDLYEENICEVFSGTELLFKVINYDCDVYVKLIDTCLRDKVELGAENSDLEQAKNNINELKKRVTSDYETIKIPGGDCTNTAWVVTDDGILIIYGYGKMNDFGAEKAPWYSEKNRIHNISIANTIDTIGSNAFYGLDALDRNVVFDKAFNYYGGCFNEIPSNINLLFAKTPHFWNHHMIKANVYSREDISDDDYGNINLYGDTFISGTVSFISYWRGIIVNDGARFSCRDMTNTDGTFIVNPGGYAEIRENLTGGSGIRANGTMVIFGDCLKLNGISISEPNAHLTIHGNIGSPEKGTGGGSITNGTVELYGNIYGEYATSGENTTILKGSKQQQFGSMKVANLRIENSSENGVKFTNWATVTNSLYSTTPNMTNGRLLRLCGKVVGNEYYGDFRLDNGATIDHDLTIHGTLYGFPNGYGTGNICEPEVTVNIDGNLDLTANGTYGGNESTLILPEGSIVNVGKNVLLSGNYYPGSNWMVQRVTLQVDGTLNTNGNFTIGTNGLASLKMNNNRAKLIIGGDYNGYHKIQKNWIETGEPSELSSEITAGAIQVDGKMDKMVAKGNASITCKGAAVTNSILAENSVLLLNSQQEQTIQDSGYIATVVLLHNNGLVFKTETRINHLFNHNGYRFEDATASVFVDYDNDGMLDNVDPYPTDPNNTQHFSEVKHNYQLIDNITATCTESGENTYKCSDCGTIKKESVNPLGHNFTWLSNTHIAPSCTDSGYTVQTCSRCGETQKTNELLAAGHDYGDIYGTTHIERVYNSNHQFRDSLSYTPNTVTKNTVGSTAIGSNEILRAGWMTLPREIRLNVDDLSAVEDYYIARQRHLLSFSAEADVPAVFAFDSTTERAPEYSAIPYTDSQGRLYELDGTGLVVSLSKAEAKEKGILNDDGTVNVPIALSQSLNLAYSAGLPGTYICLPELEFTSGFSGWNTPAQVFHYDGNGAAKAGVYTVNYCFYNEQKSGTAGTTIKVYDHAALNYTTPAKDGTPAQVHHKCIDCGEVLTEDLGFDDALKVKSASLSLGNNLIMNFKVSKEVLEGYEEPFLEVTRNGKATTLREYTEQGDNYVFSFTNIAPQTMNDEMTAVLYASKDETTYASSEVKTSVKTYLYNILDAYSADKYAKLRTLLVDLLNYGEAAQKYTGYKTGTLVTDNLTSEQKAWGSSEPVELNNITDAAYETAENPTVIWKSASLILDNAVTVRYKFSTDSIDGLSAKVQYGKTEKEFDNSSFESLGDGVYSLKFSGLSAHQLKEPVCVTVYQNGTAVSNTLLYSVESYAAQVKESQPSGTLDELATALMHYGTSAINYKNG